jgi:hypothetical protein
MDRKTKALIDGLPPALRNLLLTRTEEEGECLIWTGMTCAAFTRVPRCHYDFTGAHTKASRSLRRTIAEAMAGKRWARWWLLACAARRCVCILGT